MPAQTFQHLASYTSCLRRLLSSAISWANWLRDQHDKLPDPPPFQIGQNGNLVCLNQDAPYCVWRIYAPCLKLWRTAGYEKSVTYRILTWRTDSQQPHAPKHFWLPKISPQPVLEACVARVWLGGIDTAHPRWVCPKLDGLQNFQEINSFILSELCFEVLGQVRWSRSETEETSCHSNDHFLGEVT